MTETPETRYVRTPDGIYLGYRVIGRGEHVFVYTLNYDESNVDFIWDDPDWRRFLEGNADFGRVVVYDRRGLGVSSRNVPAATLETQVADLLTLLDAIDAPRAVLVGASAAGAMHAMFAATHPDRVTALAWNNPLGRAAWAPDYPWGGGPDEFESSQRDAELWGTRAYARLIADWRAAEARGIAQDDLGEVDHDPALLEAYARVNRNTASPDVARDIERIQWETDIRAVLTSVHVPAGLMVGTNDGLEEARYVASLMPNATLIEVEGRAGAAVGPFLDMLRQLAGVERATPEIETILSTVLFTDIVDSTTLQASLGNRAWKQLIERHHGIVRGSLARWLGVENDTAGDGFYATFDGPARAIRCASEIGERVLDLGIQIRAGVHTGECELIDDKPGGLPVTIGARVSAKAGPSEILVSQTVRDLVAGSGLTFEDAGEHELKGVPDRWRLFRVTS